MIDINCPHCEAVQMDCHNGGDPGEWWHTDNIPEGEVRINCDHCNNEFIVVCNWEPNFEGRKITSEDL